MIFKEKFFRPAIVVSISMIAAGLYFLYATLRFSGEKLFNQYYYVVPIVVPFTIFLFDRAARFKSRKPVQWLLDAMVVVTAMWRVIGDVPYVSGHALFLTFCLSTIDSLLGRISALAVLIEVIVLKFFIWNDWPTAAAGIVLGTIAAFIEKRYKPEI